MTSTGNIHSIDILIGRAVLSRATANKLGHIQDLLVDVTKGELAGIVVRMPDESLRLVDYNEIFNIGPDALMIKADESAVPAQDSPLKVLPLAKYNLARAKVVTEGGKLVGQIANIYIRMAETLLLVYEVRSSILDKLLGHALFFPASQGRAISADFARIVVAEETAEQSDNNLGSLEARLFGPPKEQDPVVVVRSRGY